MHDVIDLLILFGFENPENLLIFIQPLQITKISSFPNVF